MLETEASPSAPPTQPGAAGLDLPLYVFRFRLKALDPIVFPWGRAGNILRGAFGTLFRQIACIPGCHDASRCELRHSCSYAILFEPRAAGRGPSGLADLPRPFVFRATDLEGQHVGPGKFFEFRLHLFYTSEEAVLYFILAFARLADAGIGPTRGRAELLEVTQLDLDLSPIQQVYANSHFVVDHLKPPVVLDLRPSSNELAHRAEVRFITPTELKADGKIITDPDFATLISRIRDRISNLRSFYGPGPLDIDFVRFAEQARQVRKVVSEIDQVHMVRRSSRTGQIHPIGGFVGRIVYEGALTEFLPYLRAATWTGVGRHTVWGKGMVEVRVLA